MRPRLLGSWPLDRRSLRRRLAFPLTFVAGGVSFLVLPSLLANGADAGDEASPRRTVSGPPLAWRQVAEVDILRAAEMRDALERIKPDARGVAFSASQDRRAQFILNRRTGASEPELHDEWDDVFVFQSGMGTLRFGGRLHGARALGEKEQRGGQIDGALQTTVEPGDVVRVPAGVPHQLEPLGDAPLVYLVMKIRSTVSRRYS
jgi:mannose-6-phosphate isomerase-like protein (cupin superfamily)